LNGKKIARVFRDYDREVAAGAGEEVMQ